MTLSRLQVRLLQAYLVAMQDPEKSLFDWLARGTWIGYKEKLPRTPAVFERKTKWALRELAEDEEGEVGELSMTEEQREG